MKLKIKDIKIGQRIRHEVGDLSSLKKSIMEVGLLQPIIVNFEKELVAGLRRLEACHQLGWTEIEVTLVDTDKDNLKKIDLEYHENLGRLNLNTEDQQNYNKTRDEFLNPAQLEKGFWVWLKKFWEMIKSFFKKNR